MNKQQVRAIIKLLKSKEISNRPSLQQVFEQNNHLWATNGWVAFDICEVKDDFKNKCITLDNLLKWNAIHNKSTDMIGDDILTENEYTSPEMSKVVEGNYNLCNDLKIDLDMLKLGCEFLGCKSISFEENCTKKKLYRLKPLLEDEIPIIIRSMESKVYIMGLNFGGEE